MHEVWFVLTRQILEKMLLHRRLTVVIKSVRDLMSNHHPYPAEVQSLVLMLTEERRLQDSCREHWTDTSEWGVKSQQVLL